MERLEKVCYECGNLGFSDGGDGFFYCNRCNTRADDFIDTGVDEADLVRGGDGGIYSTAQSRARPSQALLEDPNSQIKASQSEYREILKMMDESNVDNVENDAGPADPNDFDSTQDTFTSTEFYYSEVRRKYVMGVQIMVQLQCKALVEKFNVSPLIIGLISPIWMRYLAYERVMADEWGDTVIDESQSQNTGEVGQFTPNSRNKEGGPRNLFGKRAIPLWLKSLRIKIPLSSSLAISFLVCHMARESILPTDIIKWMFEGKLPYFAAFLEIEKRLGPASRACPLSASQMFRPIQPISTQKLESFAAAIARRIGLKLPAVNFYAIASRYLRELSLPVEKVLPQACCVYEWSMPSELYLSDNEHKRPSRVCVMSILIVTIRIVYDLNGGNWETMLSASSSSNHHDNILDGEVDFDAGKILQILETKYTENKEIYDYAQDLPSYLQYCKDVVFAGLDSSSEDREEERLIEELWDFYQKNKDAESSGRPKKSKDFQDDGNKCSTSESGVNSPRDNELLNEDLYFKESYMDRAIRLLKSNMEENLFCYIPPIKQSLKKNFGYIRYHRKKDSAYIYAAHADYYILLRSCAQIAQVDVRTMHQEVLTFQKKLEQLENRIDFCLRRKLPGDPCGSCCNEDEAKE